MDLPSLKRLARAIEDEYGASLTARFILDAMGTDLGKKGLLDSK
jgi:hypothetical protein